MPNYRVMIDLADVFLDLEKYSLREYRQPFSLYILEADNPDGVCHEIMQRIMRAIIKEDASIDGRIMCRKIRKYLRIDRVEIL
tara:strand:+ start:336 stop:584 length:249 start_codon:yes stop_codon:yes gene_type:complete